MKTITKIRNEQDENIYKDSCRRDFTVNSIYYDPIKDEIYDYHGGVQDIELKRIRFVGDADERIKEDPLRMMRAIRFSHTKGFKMDSSVKDAIFGSSEDIRKVSKERIIAEMKKVASIRNPEIFHAYMVSICSYFNIFRIKSYANFKRSMLGEMKPTDYIANFFRFVDNITDFPIESEIRDRVDIIKSLFPIRYEMFTNSYVFFDKVFTSKHFDIIKEYAINENKCSNEAFNNYVTTFVKYKDIKKKYNGKFIMETFGVKGKAVGDIQKCIIKALIDNDKEIVFK